MPRLTFLVLLIAITPTVSGCDAAALRGAFQIDAGDVDAGNVDAGAVQAGEVAAGDVQAGNVQAGDVLAGDVQAGDVQAGDVQAGAVQAGPVQAGDVLAGDVLVEVELEPPGLADDVNGLFFVWTGFSTNPAAAWRTQVPAVCAGGRPTSVQTIAGSNLNEFGILVAVDCP